MVVITRSGSTATMAVGEGSGPNLLTIRTLCELHSKIDELSRSRDIRAVIVLGRGGRFFLAGADLNELSRLDGESALKFARLGQSLFAKMESLPQVVIAAVDGFCMGGGMDFLLACDLRYATPGSVFAHPGARMGIITGFGGTARLPAEVGVARARELFFSARNFTAREAFEFGLINGIVDRAELAKLCKAQAAKAAEIPLDKVVSWKKGCCTK